jgi:ABC-type uncharacterized transport system permease subunit
VTAELVFLRVAVALYLVATVVSLVGVAVRQELPRKLLTLVLWIGVVVHAVAIVVRSINAGHVAVTAFGETLSFVAMLLVAVFLGIQMRRPLVALGAVVSPLAFGLTLAADAVHRGARPLPPDLDSAWLPVHAGLSFLGFVVFALAFSASLLYLVQEHRLKARRGTRSVRHLPSLETLDRLNYTCLVWGLILLTLGIVTGVIWAHTDPALRSWLSDWKVIFSLVTWGIYVTLLQGRMTAGWQGRRAAALTIAGFAVILLSLVLPLGNHGKAF